MNQVCGDFCYSSSKIMISITFCKKTLDLSMAVCLWRQFLLFLAARLDLYFCYLQQQDCRSPLVLLPPVVRLQILSLIFVISIKNCRSSLLFFYLWQQDCRSSLLFLLPPLVRLQISLISFTSSTKIVDIHILFLLLLEIRLQISSLISVTFNRKTLDVPSSFCYLQS